MKNKINEKVEPVELPGDLRGWFATHAPEPPQWWLSQQRQFEANDLQLIVKWRWVWAEAVPA